MVRQTLLQVSSSLQVEALLWGLHTMALLQMMMALPLLPTANLNDLESLIVDPMTNSVTVELFIAS